MPPDAAATPNANAHPSTELAAGATRAVPIMLGYVVLAMAFGILAREAGLTIPETIAMSVIVFAGASQFIAAGMFAAAMSPAAIIMTTFLVNLRHILMSAALAPHLRGLRFHSYALLGWGVTDETFALNSAEYGRQPRHHWFVYGTNFAAYASWITGTIIGAFFGSLVPGIEQLPLGFALPAMFICLLVMQLSDRLLLYSAVLAGGLSLLLGQLLEGNWNIILATVVTATAASGWEKWKSSG
ncbi:MAG: AzlC family ABC transporter permease [Bacillota bacterium]